ncbi:MAG: NAD(P)/FAD-dependent oxidoreductase [Thermoplasmata archaeon]
MPKKVVVLGGGVGGTMVANALVKELKKEADVTIVDEDGKHVYQPGFAYVSFGKEKPHKLVKEEKKLLRRNVRLVVDKATVIDRENRRVELAKGSRLVYDYLILATGAEIHPEVVPGSEDAYHFYDLQASVELRNALKRFKGGKVVVAIGGVPYRCPPAPAEAICLLDYFFHKKGMRNKVDLWYLSPLVNVFPIAPVDPQVRRIMEEKNINSQTFFNVEYVDKKKKQVHSLEGESISYDLLILIPPHRGADVISDSDLGDRGGWIPTDRYTLKVKETDDVYAIGDATDLPVSKSGATAHYESPIVVEGIVSDITGMSPEKKYNGRVTCFYDAGFRRGIVMDFDYDHPPVPPPFSRRAYLKKILFNKLYWWLLPKDRLPGFIMGSVK